MLIRLGTIFLLTLFMVGCNIFGWTSDSSDDLFYDGIKLFNDKKFTEAKAKFAEAIDLDENRSDYRYYHAKSAIFETDINFLTVGRNVVDTSKDKKKAYLPLYSAEDKMSPQAEMEYKNEIYQVVNACHDDIHPIFMARTHGTIVREDILFEYSLFSLTRAILQLRDTNNDGVIDDKDFYFSIQVYEGTVKYNVQLGTVDPKTILEALTNSIEYLGFGADALLETFGKDGEKDLINSQELEDVMEQLELELQNKLPKKP